MSEHFELAVQVRDTLGSRAQKRLRQEDFIPAVIYGGDEKPQALQIEHRKIAKALENEGFYTHMLQINIAGKKQKAILRAVQRHPYKPRILHVDFMRVSPKQMLTMMIPLHFMNEEIAPGVKDQHGLIEHQMVKVEVKCRADHIPEYIEVDLAHLELNQSIHLADLKLPKGVELPELALGAEHNHMVVAIHLPRVIAEPEALPTEAEAAATEAAQSTEESEKK